MKKKADWIDNILATKEDIHEIFSLISGRKEIFSRFLNSLVSNSNFASRVAFECGQPVINSYVRDDEPSRVEVILFHILSFPTLPLLLEQARAARDNDEKVSRAIWTSIDDELYKLFGINTEGVYCSCSHDCCAHWFTRGFDIKVRGNVVRLKRTWHMNI